MNDLGNITKSRRGFESLWDCYFSALMMAWNGTDLMLLTLQ